jgi:putative redox protein
MTAKIVYQGNLRTEATHIYSNSTIQTDAPLDNQGLAQRFSPTDLVATALGSCMLTIMGIAARTHDINIDGTTIEVQKIMANDPRSIGEIIIDFYFEVGLQLDDKQKTILERAALNCPVHKSLSADMVQTVNFHW